MLNVKLKTGSGADANGAFNPKSKKIRIKAGSILTIDPDAREIPSNIQQNYKTAKLLVQSGALRQIPMGKYQVMQDIPELSVSGSSVIVTGKAGTGWTQWCIDEPNQSHNGKVINTLRTDFKQMPNDAHDEVVLTQSVQKERKNLDFSKIIAALSVQSTSELIESVRMVFKEANRYHAIREETVSGLKARFPTGPGVYIVKYFKTGFAGNGEILYIGKAGKFKRGSDGKLFLNKGNLSHRIRRWTPYCYQDRGKYENHFEFGPRFKSKSSRDLREDCYAQHIPLTQIETECFALTDLEKQISPSFLESLFLQAYLLQHQDLPQANREY